MLSGKLSISLSISKSVRNFYLLLYLWVRNSPPYLWT